LCRGCGRGAETRLVGPEKRRIVVETCGESGFFGAFSGEDFAAGAIEPLVTDVLGYRIVGFFLEQNVEVILAYGKEPGQGIYF
jgi:hypothetical protein